MKRRLLDHLKCPLDRSSLELREWESVRQSLERNDIERAERMGVDPQALEHEVLTGVLVNESRKLLYPVHSGVPRMLTFSNAVARQFADLHAARLHDEFAGYAFANESSMPGESDVLRTFSSEWVNYDWNSRSYWNLTPDAWFRAMRFVMQLDRFPVQDKLVMEIGMGIGGVADYMARTERCEMIGVDLGYAVDAGYKHFGRNPFLHIVQASAFAPPFADRCVDFAYSFGVIHHTFSTKTAFESIARLPKREGRLYVWVYSHYDEQRTLTRRGLMALERMIRPVVWRLPERAQGVVLAPLVPLYMLYQSLRAVRNPDGAVRYGFREAMHAARDRFTPRFIHRHTEEELCEWFREAGYDSLTQGSELSRPDSVPIAFTASTGVSGFRSERVRTRPVESKEESSKCAASQD
jgi:uncharacterized protein YbaR (Trm112 family)/SAM-dependent methyltransferase